tara:strand:- start:836 stop:1471 length:636 start_codon:yes stop_codon:yes gene_type:complete
MSRNLDADMVTALSDAEIQIFFAVQLNFDSQQLYLWTGFGEISIDGNTYTGAGNFLQFSSIEETSEIAARGAVITLSGIPSDLISLALSEPYQGRVCRIYFGVLDAKTFYLLQENAGLIEDEKGVGIGIDFNTAADDVITEVFSGYIDQMDISEEAETSTIGLSVESKLIDLERSRTFRYTSESQKAKYPNDLAFDFVEDLQDRKFSWGRK